MNVEIQLLPFLKKTSEHRVRPEGEQCIVGSTLLGYRERRVNVEEMSSVVDGTVGSPVPR